MQYKTSRDNPAYRNSSESERLHTGSDSLAETTPAEWTEHAESGVQPFSQRRKTEKSPAQINFHGIVGASKATSRIVNLIAKVADCDATVLIQGESGTGKEVIARAIHQSSGRSSNPFVVINCTTIVDTLMESELFGHERGSFTGATERKAGKFEVADHGTVFLDEISELPIPLQPKLLRIIQEKEFTRVGGAKPLKTNIRLIASTNRDINNMVQEGHFRQDLYYRLKVVRIQLPPLKERPDDIPALAQHFLEKFATRYGRLTRGIEEKAMKILMSYSWPGNVRDLEHVIERAIVMSDQSMLEPADLLFDLSYQSQEQDNWNYQKALQEFNRNYLLRVLSKTRGNKREAARLIQISHAKLYRLLAKSGLSL